jgi:hypothetical protein
LFIHYSSEEEDHENANSPPLLLYDQNESIPEYSTDVGAIVPPYGEVPVVTVAPVARLET